MATLSYKSPHHSYAASLPSEAHGSALNYTPTEITPDFSPPSRAPEAVATSQLAAAAAAISQQVSQQVAASLEVRIPLLKDRPCNPNASEPKLLSANPRNAPAPRTAPAPRAHPPPEHTRSQNTAAAVAQGRLQRLALESTRPPNAPAPRTHQPAVAQGRLQRLALESSTHDALFFLLLLRGGCNASHSRAQHTTHLLERTRS